MRLRTALGAGPGRAPVLDLLEEVELRRQDGAVVVVVCAAREPRVSAAAEQARGQPALGTLTALARARGPAGPQTRGCMLSAGPSHAPLWSGVPSCAKHAELTVYGPRAALPAGSAQTHPACRQGAPRPVSNLPGSPACQAAKSACTACVWTRQAASSTHATYNMERAHHGWSTARGREGVP